MQSAFLIQFNNEGQRFYGAVLFYITRRAMSRKTHAHIKNLPWHAQHEKRRKGAFL